MDVDATWADYFRTRDPALRNLLVERHLEIVDQVVGRVASTLPAHVERDDLVSYGTLGLIDAVSRFDPGTGAKFYVFAWARIRGSIYDGLRGGAGSYARRAVRDVSSRIDQARNDLRHRHRREPTRVELATALEVTVDELDGMLAQVEGGRGPVSLDDALVTDDDSVDLWRALTDGQDITADYEINELRELLADAWNRLPVRERTVLALRYLEGLRLTDVADILGIGVSRTSRLATDGVRLLRSNITRR